jgi:hypothetical protein
VSGPAFGRRAAFGCRPAFVLGLRRGWGAQGGGAVDETFDAGEEERQPGAEEGAGAGAEGEHGEGAGEEGGGEGEEGARGNDGGGGGGGGGAGGGEGGAALAPGVTVDLDEMRRAVRGGWPADEAGRGGAEALGASTVSDEDLRCIFLQARGGSKARVLQLDALIGFVRERVRRRLRNPPAPRAPSPEAPPKKAPPARGSTPPPLRAPLPLPCDARLNVQNHLYRTICAFRLASSD